MDMNQYIGTKLVKAVRMTRSEYNEYRGWSLPANENPKDEGYLVEYQDGGKPNDERHKGYISWCPEEQFENANIPYDTFGLEGFQERIIAEKAQLDNSILVLKGAIETNKFYIKPEKMSLMVRQLNLMQDLSFVLDQRIKSF